jgi:hypothetical protein
MKFNRNYIIILSILGLILLYSYYYFFRNNKNSPKLWGKIRGNLLNVYYISMLLSTIGFLLLFYFLVTSSNFTLDTANNIFYALLSIIIISMFWMPVSLQYLNNNKLYIKILILIILLIVAFSTLYLLNNVHKIKDESISKKLAIIGMIYFFIHAFFFDSIIWSYNFF